MHRARSLLAPAALAGLLAAAAPAQAGGGRDYIYIVGSSTVYPFATVVAERFGKTTEFRTPKVESTGSGGGFKLFCAGVGLKHPDINNASRRIKRSEVERCAANGVGAILEVKIGYDGIVVAGSRAAPRLALSLRDLWLALAKNVPDPAGGERLVANPYRTWREVNPALPATPIEVLGPPPTSGTRDAFAELAMEGGCRTFPWVKALRDSDRARYRAVCHGIREDGAYVEAGENDNLIVAKLERNPRALGIFGYSFLDQNGDRIQGSLINGTEPTFEHIASGDYPLSRPLFFYVKTAHVGRVPGIRAYLAEFTRESTWGEDGYLADKGLIPMPRAERERYLADTRSLKRLELVAR